MPPTLDYQPAPQRKSKRGLVIIVSALILLLLLAGAVMGHSGRAEKPILFDGIAPLSYEFTR